MTHKFQPLVSVTVVDSERRAGEITTSGIYSWCRACVVSEVNKVLLCQTLRRLYSVGGAAQVHFDRRRRRAAGQKCRWRRHGVVSAAL